MKLILTREVPKLGAAGDVVTVKDGQKAARSRLKAFVVHVALAKFAISITQKRLSQPLRKQL